MLILAFESSTDFASCALFDGHRLVTRDVARGEGASGQHSALFLPAVTQVLAELGLTFAELDAIAFGAGPGAFTGLRMACALAQGCAVAHKLPVIPVCSLDAMAYRAAYLAGHPAGQTMESLALLDARMGEIYVLHAVVGEGVTHRGPISLLTPEQITHPAPVQLVCGNVFKPYPQLLDGPWRGTAQVIELVPHAREVALLAAQAWQRGEWVDAAEAAPYYVRDKVAKTVVERMAEGRPT